MSGGTCGDGLLWDLTSGVLTITAEYEGAEMYNFVDDPNIPEELPPWWAEKDTIKKIVLGWGTYNVGNYAFSHLPYLENIDFGETCERLGMYAFYQCDFMLTHVTIPESVTIIYSRCFEACAQITDVRIKGKPKIFSRAFKGCALNNVYFDGGIPSSLGEDCFNATDSEPGRVVTFSTWGWGKDHIGEDQLGLSGWTTAKFENWLYFRLDLGREEENPWKRGRAYIKRRGHWEKGSVYVKKSVHWVL